MKTFLLVIMVACMLVVLFIAGYGIGKHHPCEHGDRLLFLYCGK